MTIVDCNPGYQSVKGGEIQFDKEDGLPAITRPPKGANVEVIVPSLGVYAVTHSPNGGPCDDPECVRCSTTIPEIFPD